MKAKRKGLSAIESALVVGIAALVFFLGITTAFRMTQAREERLAILPTGKPPACMGLEIREFRHKAKEVWL